MPVETYGLWTNKGGVGKTTLTFHLSTLYAHLHPEKRVILIDMCPQANLSSTVLTNSSLPAEKGDPIIRSGSEIVAQLRDKHPVPKTVVGYIHTKLPQGMGLKHLPPNFFLTKINDYNPNVPSNMWLFCGDGRLDDLNQTLASMGREAMNVDPTRAVNDPYKVHLRRLRDFLDDLVSPESDLDKSDWKDKDVVVFVDTNPAFSEYTQIALCAIDKLVVPVNADDFSMQAAEYMFRNVWGMYENDKDGFSAYRSNSFAVKAKQRAEDILPRIQLIVHNRHNIINTKAVAVFRALHEEQATFFFNTFRRVKVRAGPDGRLSVFADDKGAQLTMESSRKDFEDLFTATMRDMFSTGLASAHTGIPLHNLRRNRALLKTKFGVGVVAKHTLENLVKDMLDVLGLAINDPALDGPSVHRDRVEELIGDMAALAAENGAAENGASGAVPEEGNPAEPVAPGEPVVARAATPAKKAKKPKAAHSPDEAGPSAAAPAQQTKKQPKPKPAAAKPKPQAAAKPAKRKTSDT